MSTSTERDAVRDSLWDVAVQAALAANEFTKGRQHFEYLQLAADAFGAVLASFDDDADSGWLEADDEDEFTEGCADPDCDCNSSR